MLETIDAIIENLDTNEPEALLESIEILKDEINKIRPYLALGCGFYEWNHDAGEGLMAAIEMNGEIPW